MFYKANVKRGTRFNVEIKGDLMIITVSEPLKNNKANIQIIKELTKRYGSCKIIKGLTSNKKLIEIK